MTEAEALDVETRSASDKEVDALDGEKRPVETGEETDAIQTDKCVPESDPPPAAVRGRLPDDFVTLILAMPKEIPMDTEDLSFIDDLARLMNRSEDWIEERKKRYLARAALSKRINEQFVQMQDSLREEWCTKGYVETEADFDFDARDARDAMAEKFHRELWNLDDPERGLHCEVNCTEEDSMMAPA